MDRQKILDMVGLDTWIISDTHFGHEAIVGFCNRPIRHNVIMEAFWHDLVKPEDTILHLGDVATWKTKKDEHRDGWLPVLRDLPGQKLLVLGNHDKNGGRYYKLAGFEEVGMQLGEFVEEDVTREGVPYKNTIRNNGFYADIDGKRILFSHYPDAWLLDWDINIHGHIHNNPISPKVAALKRDHRNVSVEVMDYRPTRLSAILNL
jgi:calcineurin-like phosphoesterase family protein